MALPADLQRLLLWALPFSTIEQLPGNFAGLWLQHNYPANYAVRERYRTNVLLPTELNAKVAAWSGAPSFANQIFLPYWLTNLTVIHTNNVALFADTLLRGQFNDHALLVILRQLMHNPTAAEDMLAYLLSVGYPIAPLILPVIRDDLVTGRIVLTPRAQRIILAASSHVSPSLVNIVRGMVGQPPINTESEVVSYALGEFLAQQRLSAVHDTWGAFMVALFFNLPFTVQQVDAKIEKTILLTLASETLRVNVTGRDLPFPTNIVIRITYVETLRARAASMLTLVTERYAPSIDRDEYLAALRFILDPTSPDPDVNIPPRLLLVLNRLDLLPEEEVWDISHALSDTWFYLPNVATFLENFLPILDNFTASIGGQSEEAELTAKFSRCNILRPLLATAAVTGKLAAVSAILFAQIPFIVWPHNSNENPNQTLENWRVTLQHHLNISVQRAGAAYFTAAQLKPIIIYWQNSLVLQHVQEQLTFDKFDERGGGNLDVGALEFHIGDVQVIEQVTRYDYDTWRMLGLALPEILTADPQLVEIARLLRA